MKHIEKIKEMLNGELEIFGKKNALTIADLEKIHKLTDTIKNLDKIMLLEEDEYETGGSSYARGRGRSAKRDSMGRYSSDVDYYDDDVSYARGACFANKVKAYTPYCQNLGLKSRDSGNNSADIKGEINSNSNPCNSQFCQLSVRKKVRFF